MRKYLDENDTIGEIRQAQKHPMGRNYIWILVEGITDQKLYSKLIDGSNSQIQMVHGGGKNNLQDVLIELIKESNKVIGIRDADFLHLDNQNVTIAELFLTDSHDAEMMLLACDNVFKQVMAEYMPNQFDEFNSFRNRLLTSLKFISGIRWLNNTEDLSLLFDGLSLTSFYDATRLTLNKIKCIEYIERRSSKKKRTIQAEEIELKIANISDYYNLCNGHDVVKALALYITANTNTKKGIGDDEIAKVLRVTYRKDDFISTKLYRDLKNWEQKTKYVLFQN